MSELKNDYFGRWFWVVGAAVVAGLAIALPMKVFMEHQEAQRRRMAEQFAARMQPVLAADARYRDVSIEPFSGYGCVRLEGTVESDDRLETLRQLVQQSLGVQPIDVKWHVNVRAPDPATTRAAALHEETK